MADLIVDMDALSALQSSLTFVNDDFKNLAADINNWRAHRAKLEAAIDALLQMVTQTTQRAVRECSSDS